ncbi:MAG TPA: hypothetical protein VJ603_04135 [Paucimonas sp.]|nr:hypothetical protein [Paucimonas sp.]HJW53712.1 hypothetical protein [Burkholderiaceae bacterium]
MERRRQSGGEAPAGSQRTDVKRQALRRHCPALAASASSRFMPSGTTWAIDRNGSAAAFTLPIHSGIAPSRPSLHSMIPSR